jgi:hypothetical protein
LRDSLKLASISSALGTSVGRREGSRRLILLSRVRFSNIPKRGTATPMSTTIRCLSRTPMDAVRVVLRPAWGLSSEVRLKVA